MSKNIERLIQKEKWQPARKLIFKELKIKPQNHWLLTRLSLTYYEEKKYTTALKISRKALKMMPGCPLALWDYAEALEMTGKPKKAITIWRKLLKYRPVKSDYETCWEGKAWARSLKNDCRYRLGKSHMNLRNRRLAIKYLKDYLNHCAQGVKSIYKIPAIKKELIEIKSK